MKRKQIASIQSTKNKLQFYLSKAGKNLPHNRKAVLALAREEWRILFGR